MDNQSNHQQKKFQLSIETTKKKTKRAISYTHLLYQYAYMNPYSLQNKQGENISPKVDITRINCPCISLFLVSAILQEVDNAMACKE